MGDIQQNRCGSAVVLAAFAGAAAAGFSCYAYSRWQKAQSHHNRSLKTVTTPASHDAPSDFPQELSDALQLHYGGDAMKELLNEMGLVFGSEFAADCAQICERNCDALQDFTGEKGEATALDLGCSVGGTSFELRQVFPMVVGVDPDPIRIDLAKHISRGKTWFHRGHMLETDALLPDSVFEEAKADPPMFITTEPGAFLDTVRTPFSCVLCAGLLERCDSPRRILERLHRAVKPGGIVVIVFGWFWDLGVFPQKDSEHGTEQPSGLDKLIKATMEKRFDFVEEHMLAMITNKVEGNFGLQLGRANIWRLRPKETATAAGAS